MKTTLLLASCLILGMVTCTAPQENSDKTEQLPEPSTSIGVQLAQQQVEGYNRRDLDAFLAPYSDSVKVYNKHELSYQGIDKMRAANAEWFASVDTLHAKILDRISEGNTVIDHEEVYYKLKDGQANTMHSIAIYTIQNEKIQEIIFLEVGNN